MVDADALLESLKEIALEEIQAKGREYTVTDLLGGSGAESRPASNVLFAGLSQRDQVGGQRQSQLGTHRVGERTSADPATGQGFLAAEGLDHQSSMMHRQCQQRDTR